MPKVFIVNDSGLDFSSARGRGELVYLTTGKINVFATEKLLNELIEKLAASTAEDYLLPAGNSLASCLAFSIWLQQHGKINLLIFSFRNQEYEIRTIRKEQYKHGNGKEAK